VLINPNSVSDNDRDDDGDTSVTSFPMTADGYLDDSTASGVKLPTSSGDSLRHVARGSTSLASATGSGTPQSRAWPEVLPTGAVGSTGSAAVASLPVRGVGRATSIGVSPTSRSSTGAGVAASVTPGTVSPVSVRSAARPVPPGRGPVVVPATTALSASLPALPPPLPPVLSSGVIGGARVSNGVGSSPPSSVTPVGDSSGADPHGENACSTPGKVGKSSPGFDHPVATPMTGEGRSRPSVATVPIPGVRGSRVALSSGVSRPLFSLEQVGDLARCQL
jgi:hypothetical protein